MKLYTDPAGIFVDGHIIKNFYPVVHYDMMDVDRSMVLPEDYGCKKGASQA